VIDVIDVETSNRLFHLIIAAEWAQAFEAAAACGECDLGIVLGFVSI
jgi:hypothetical protein